LHKLLKKQNAALITITSRVAWNIKTCTKWHRPKCTRMHKCQCNSIHFCRSVHAFSYYC